METDRTYGTSLAKIAISEIRDLYFDLFLDHQKPKYFNEASTIPSVLGTKLLEEGSIMKIEYMEDMLMVTEMKKRT